MRVGSGLRNLMCVVAAWALIGGCVTDPTSQDRTGSASQIDREAEPGAARLYVELETTSDWTELEFASEAHVTIGAATMRTPGAVAGVSTRGVYLGQSIETAEAGREVRMEAALEVSLPDVSRMEFAIARGGLGETTARIYLRDVENALLLGEYEWDGQGETDRNEMSFSVVLDWAGLAEVQASSERSAVAALVADWAAGIQDPKRSVLHLYWDDALLTTMQGDADQTAHNAVEALRAEEDLPDPRIDYGALEFWPSYIPGTDPGTQKVVTFNLRNGRPSGTDLFHFERRGGEWRIADQVWKQRFDVDEYTPDEPEPDTGEVFVWDVSTDDVFPVLHTHYAEHPFGVAVIANSSWSNATRVRVTFFVDRYMDVPVTLDAPSSVESGALVEVPVRAIFTNEILDIVQTTRLAAEIRVRSEIDGRVVESTYDHILDVHDRNAATWDDDRKVASFVTPKDPPVLGFARYVAGIVEDVGTRQIPHNLRTAMAVCQTMEVFGLRYARDPGSSYAMLSEVPAAIDYLQFPRQTLTYRAGDCDDLSICLNALFEAAAVPAAFITVPGHIFTAFSLGLAPADARRAFGNDDNLIFIDSNTWIPVEATALGEGFLNAWETGARQWREHESQGQARLLPVSECWKAYEAVGLPATEERPQLPDRDAAVAGYRAELTRFIDRVIFPAVSELQGRIRRGTDVERNELRLGVLYARYGIYDEARAAFLRVLDHREHPMALINLGNLEFLAQEPLMARDYYERALVVSPDNSAGLLGVAMAHFRLADYESAGQAYARFKEVSSEIAGEYSYLDSGGSDGTRAADVDSLQYSVRWQEPDID